MLLILASIGGGVWHFIKPIESPVMVEQPSYESDFHEKMSEAYSTNDTHDDGISDEEIARMNEDVLKRIAEHKENLRERVVAENVARKEQGHQRDMQSKRRGDAREDRNINRYVNDSSGIIDACYSWYKNDQKKLSDCIKRQSKFRK